MKSLKLITLAFAAVALASCVTQNTPPEPASQPPVAETQETTTTNPVGSRDTSLSERGEDVTIDLNSVFYFEFDKSTLTAQTRSDLSAYAAALRSSPRNIRLEGHADERGTREYNIALGERRAQSVADYLIASGVSASNIEVISYGEERPAVSGSTRLAWQQNRRVELK